MQKKIIFIFCWVILSFINYSYGQHIIDVNKYWRDIPEGIDPEDVSDSYMCWAAAGANVLTYTGWGIDNPHTSYPIEYDVYHEFLAHFPNEGGYGIFAYADYINNHYYDGGPPNNYLQYYVVLRPTEVGITGLIPYIKMLLDPNNTIFPGSYGIFLTIGAMYSPSIGWAHAITIWDVIEIKNFYTGEVIATYLKYTDSDDGITGYQLAKVIADGWFIEYNDESVIWFNIEAFAPNPNRLTPINHPLTFNPTLPNNFQPLYALASDYSQNYQNIYLDPIVGPNLPWVVPEPSSLFLFAFGLIGAGLFKRRIKKR